MPVITATSIQLKVNSTTLAPLDCVFVLVLEAERVLASGTEVNGAPVIKGLRTEETAKVCVTLASDVGVVMASVDAGIPSLALLVIGRMLTVDGTPNDVRTGMSRSAGTYKSNPGLQYRNSPPGPQD